MAVNLPSPPPASPDSSYLRRLCSILEMQLNRLFQPKSIGWRPQNTPSTSLSTFKEFDADTADLDTLRKAFAVLITELTNAGTLSNGN